MLKYVSIFFVVLVLFATAEAFDSFEDHTISVSISCNNADLGLVSPEKAFSSVMPELLFRFNRPVQAMVLLCASDVVALVLTIPFLNLFPRAPPVKQHS